MRDISINYKFVELRRLILQQTVDITTDANFVKLLYDFCLLTGSRLGTSVNQRQNEKVSCTVF